MTWLWLAIAALILCFGLVLLVGAPYLPTRKAQQRTLFELIGKGTGQTLLDLGSGDGSLLLAAAKRGYRAVGYEINPILFAVSKLRTLRYRAKIEIHMANFWRATWPKADAIYVFLRSEYMEKLNTKLIQYHYKPVLVASYGFQIRNKDPIKRANGIFLYKYK